MFSLLRTEWLKIKNYPAFWIILSITALSYPGINYVFFKSYKDLVSRKDATSELVNALMGNPFTFPEVWRTSAYASSVFVFIPAILVIMLIANEYQYKTGRQNIIDGWSRNNFMAGKLLDVIIITCVITLLYTLVAIAIGMSNNPESNPEKWKFSFYAGLLALQTFAQLSLAFFIGFTLRKAFLSLGIFVFYYIIIEPIAVQFLKIYPKEMNPVHDAGRFFPLEISDRIIPPPAFIGRMDKSAYEASLKAVNIHILYTILFIFIIWIACFWINKKKDL
jgi:ABC-2 type transport system permease protein